MVVTKRDRGHFQAGPRSVTHFTNSRQCCPASPRWHNLRYCRKHRMARRIGILPSPATLSSLAPFHKCLRKADFLNLQYNASMFSPLLALDFGARLRSEATSCHVSKATIASILRAISEFNQHSRAWLDLHTLAALCTRWPHCARLHACVRLHACIRLHACARARVDAGRGWS
jgi:hypothetical protein